MTQPLKLWFLKNRAHPYPSRAEKVLLAEQSGLKFNQVNNWFCNARRRLKAGEPEPSVYPQGENKHSILQRYLNDTLRYGHNTSHYPEISANPIHRYDSLSSADHEDDASSVTHYQQSLLDQPTPTSTQVHVNRNGSSSPSYNLELPHNMSLNDKELSAVRALTYLALGHR
ncbi:hypothetical protein EB796_001007 [Bugula neritina]|uniref:Homeobox domain-containing protein n=1 Tax=Bugula neritina TaxID=10212 RepID=A0A7J7KRA5_BUGNE|nr:hypothetical protein EB796_001007 [Bugula neritina]